MPGLEPPPSSLLALFLQVKDKVNTFKDRAATAPGQQASGSSEMIKKPMMSLFAAIAKLANKRQTSSGKCVLFHASTNSTSTIAKLAFLTAVYYLHLWL